MQFKIKPDSLNLNTQTEKQQTFSLLFKDKNQTSFLPLKLESVANIFLDFKAMMVERVNTLSFISKNNFAKLQNLHPNLNMYGRTKVSYSEMAFVPMESLEGISISVKEYGGILRQALDLTNQILEIELPGLNKVVAQLATNKECLNTFKPVPALNELIIHTEDIKSIKKVLKDTIKTVDTVRYTKFGEAYYSFEEFEDCKNLAKEFNKALNGIKSKNYGKRINEAVQGIDILINKMQNTDDIPKANFELYSNIIEECSVSLSFAGATISLIQTFITVIKNHNDEVNKYDKERR